MANIHGFRDLEHQNNGPRVQRVGGLAGPSGYQPQVNDGDYSPLPPFSQILCPSYKISPRSFIFVTTILQILYFIATLVVAQVKYHAMFVASNTMVGPSGRVFLLLGAKYTPYIQQGEVYRLLVPVYMHGGFIHILLNLFFQCNLGFRFEELWGVKRMAAIYILSGIGGNLMSAVANSTSISVGASGALFGLLGAQLAYLGMNWTDVPGAAMSTCNIVMVIFINFLFSFSGVVDAWAHFGGLIIGILVGLGFVRKISESFSSTQRSFKNGGAFLTVVYYAIMLCMIFFVV